MRELIVNADDFGYTRGVNRAIVDAHRTGILTSTSLLANGAAFDDAVKQARTETGFDIGPLDIGCHVNFVEGAPISPVKDIPHLVASDGNFHSAARLALRLIRGGVPQQELERECSAQVEKLLGAGIEPSHLDTHKHTHLHPTVASAVVRTARKYGIGWIRRPFENCPVPELKGMWLRQKAVGAFRWLSGGFDRLLAAEGLRSPEFFAGVTLTGRLGKAALAGTLHSLPAGLTELMCHPGYCDGELQASSTRLKTERELEFEAVADSELRGRLAESGIVLSSFQNTKPVLLQALEGPLQPAQARVARELR